VMRKVLFLGGPLDGRYQNMPVHLPRMWKVSKPVESLVDPLTFAWEDTAYRLTWLSNGVPVYRTP